MAATTSSSAPKLTLVQATLVQAVSPLTLADKVAALNTELNLTSTAISNPAVEAIAAMLGMAEAIKGKPLVEQVNACYAAVFSTVSDPSAEVHCGRLGIKTAPRRSTEAGPAAVKARVAGVAEVHRVLKPRDLAQRAARLQCYLSTVPVPLLRKGPALAHAIRRCPRAPLVRGSDS